jgi:4'-phosphopantetheinyl transferase EntD
MTDVEAALRDMLGPSVAVALSDPRAQVDDLWPDEQAYVTRAIPKRRFEFAAGRRAARQALTELDLPPTMIPQAPDRAPIWPKGVIGSITHCDTLCITALAPQSIYRSLGIDIERNTPLPADLEAVVATPSEQRALATLPSPQRLHMAKQIFCAKEALYKAQYPVTQLRLGFQDVELDILHKQGLLWRNPPSMLDAPAPLVAHVHVVKRLVLASCIMS